MAYYGRIPEPRRPDGIIPARKGVEIPLYIRKQDVWDTGCDRAGIYLRHVWGTLVPGIYKEPQENHTAYAWTWVYSPKAQDVGAWIEFQNYSRSEMDLPPLPGNGITGKAECGSTTGKSCLRYGRQRTGPNPTRCCSATRIVSCVLPCLSICRRMEQGIHETSGRKFTAPEIRLPKWMFTFVFVTPDGEKAVDGLVYSPDKKR